MQLDVYRDPWIDAQYTDGHIDRLSLRECIAQSRDIQFLFIQDAKYALDNTVPYTLLTMIVGRVFKSDQDEKLEMLENGKFNIEQIDNYIETCKQKGVSFDVFDEKRPFLQDPEYKERPNIKTNITVGILEPFMISGNNTVFYHNKDYDTNGGPLEKELFMTPAQFIASIARNHMYHNSSGQSCGTGYVPSQPPLHGMIHGKNLFETIVLSLPRDLCGVPLWERRYDMTVPEIIAAYGRLDYLSAAFLPTISIRFGDVDGQNVKTIFYLGNIYKNKDSEKPKEYTKLFYVPTKTGMNLFLKERKVQEESEFVPIGMNGGADLTATVLQIMQNFNHTNDVKFISEAIDEGLLAGPFQLTVYGGKLIGTGTEPQSMMLRVPVPAALMHADVSRYVKGIATYAELASSKLRGNLLKLEREIQSGKKLQESGAVKTIVRHFSEYACDQLTMSQLRSNTWIEQIIQEPTDEKQQEIFQQIRNKAMESYYSYRTNYILYSAKYAAQLTMDLSKI